MARVVKIATFTKTTTGTISIPTGFLPVMDGSPRADYIAEMVTVGTGDTWQTPTLNYVHPNGVITPVGTFADFTATGTKVFAWSYTNSTAATSMLAVPVNMFKATLQTAGSSTLTLNLYIVTDGPN